MSGLAFTMVWEFSKAKGGPLLVLMALAEYSDRNFRVQFDMKRVSEMSRLHPTSVSRAITELLSAGELKVLSPASGKEEAVYEIVPPDGVAYWYAERTPYKKKLRREVPTKDVAREVYDRDGMSCVYCGNDTRKLHLDHVMPSSKGGNSDRRNLVVSCSVCNIRKNNKSVFELGLQDCLPQEVFDYQFEIDEEYRKSLQIAKCEEIPTGPHTSSEISNLASEEDDEGPDGEEGGDSLPPEDAPVSPVAGGGTFEIYRPSEPEAPKEPRPKRIVPSHLPPTDVGAVLAALGVKPDARGPLFWWRQEHNDALTAALDALGLPDADALIERIKESGTKVEALNCLRDLAGMRF